MASFGQWLLAQANRSDDDDPVKKIALTWQNTAEGRPRVHSPTGISNWFEKLETGQASPEYLPLQEGIIQSGWRSALATAVLEYQHRGDTDITRITTPAAEDRLARIESKLDRLLALLTGAEVISGPDEDARTTHLLGPSPSVPPADALEVADGAQTVIADGETVIQVSGPAVPGGGGAGQLARLAGGGFDWAGMHAIADFSDPDQAVMGYLDGKPEAAA